MLDLAPVGFIWNVEVVLVRVLKLLLDQILTQLVLRVLLPQFFSVMIELVTQSFQEQHPKDVFLKL